jgi:hypothetical protein
MFTSLLYHASPQFATRWFKLTFHTFAVDYPQISWRAKSEGVRVAVVA